MILMRSLRPRVLDQYKRLQSRKERRALPQGRSRYPARELFYEPADTPMWGLEVKC